MNHHYYIVSPLNPLNPEEYPGITELAEPVSWMLPLLSIIDGRTQAKVYSDGEAAFLWAGQKAYLIGQPSPGFIEETRRLIDAEFIPLLRQRNASGFRLHHTPDSRESLTRLLHGMENTLEERLYYELDTSTREWTVDPPEGYSVHKVTQRLLGDPGLGNRELVEEETLSERGSVEEFLAFSFGYVVVHDGDAVSWCMSEYNTRNRCEIGIETLKPHRRKGLASLAASATIRHAAESGVNRVGWHCYSSNAPSVATALKLGFRRLHGYRVHWVKPGLLR